MHRFTLIIIALFMLACGSPDASKLFGTSDNPGSCTPGEQETCGCPEGKGIQVCNSDGSGYDACQCTVDNGSGGSGGAGGTGSPASTTGSGGSGSSGGSNGGAGSGGGSCVPLTKAEACDAMGLNCGMVDAGCGFEVNCGAISWDPDACVGESGEIDASQACGMGDLVVNAQGYTDGSTLPGNSNVCGGGCAKALPNLDATYCGGEPHPHAVLCAAGEICTDLLAPDGFGSCSGSCGDNFFCCDG